MIEEGAVSLPIDVPDTVRKDMSPFYNPKMRLNRDVTLAVLDAVDHSGFDTFFPLSGTGIRALRCLKELDVVDSAVVNDINENFPDRFKTYAEQNNVSLSDVSVRSEDARSLSIELRSFDFVEIDPFGSPNPFLDGCIQQLRDGGVISLTATDTAPLSGTYPTTCQRKYWARPMRNHAMHEYGLRILIRKVQLIASQYSRCLEPIISYASDHYFKVIFRCSKSKQACHELQDHFDTVNVDEAVIGPLWTGRLGDPTILTRVNMDLFPDETEELLRTLAKEVSIDQVGFFDVHEEASKTGLGGPPSMDDVLVELRGDGHDAVRTHFSHTGIRTDASLETLRSCLVDATR